jgi:hypothetical protein
MSVQCPFVWWRAAHQTEASLLLAAFDGDQTRMAQAMMAMGPDRFKELVNLGQARMLVDVLSAFKYIDQLGNAANGSVASTNAVLGLRQAARSYATHVEAGQREVLPRATQQTQAHTGEPARFPPQIQARGPKPGPVELFTIAREAAYKGIGGQIDRTTNRALDRFVFEPWNRFVAQPTAAAAMDMYSRFTSTPVGEYFESQRVRAAGAVQSAVGENSAIGTVLRAFDHHLVRNERLWQTLDTVGMVGRRAAGGAAATTLAVIANAYRSGTLQTGTFNTSGVLTPAQTEMVRGINIPRNMNVRYFTAPMTIPVTVRGQTYNVQAHATIVVGDGSNVVLLPALGPGQAGAQPWFGPVHDGGQSRNERQLVAASSSVAAARWDVLGFNIGTTNFNVGGRADLQAGRGLLNIFAAQLQRQPPAPGQPRAKLQTIVIGDLWSTFHTATFNVGPLALVVDRHRNPQNERVTFPNARNTITFGRDAHPSSVQPAVPLTGAATWDPDADDVQMLKAVFGFPSTSAPRAPP